MRSEVGAEEGRSKRHNLKSGFITPGTQHARSTPKELSQGKEQKGLDYGMGVQAGRSLSFSKVVLPVASRHRSMASRRAAATASLRRAAPLAMPAASLRTGA